LDIIFELLNALFPLFKIIAHYLLIIFQVFKQLQKLIEISEVRLICKGQDLEKALVHLLPFVNVLLLELLELEDVVDKPFRTSEE